METKENTRRQPPLLLISYGPDIDRKYSLYNVLENRCDTVMAPILSDKRLLPCNYGWLVLRNWTTNDSSLWNAISREMIRLPELSKLGIYNNCVLSKPPTEPGCHILFKSSCKCNLAFCQIGDDEFVEMSIEDNEDVERVQTLKFFYGSIYALVGLKLQLRLMTISFVGKTIEFKPILKSGQPWRISPSLQPWSDREWYYLIEDHDAMLLVCKMSRAYYVHRFFDFKIFRIDINGLECVEILDIGERTIFLSNRGDAFCCSSTGMKPNSIYYTHMGRNLYVYNLGKRSTVSLLPCPTADRIMSTTSWIEHNFSII